MAERTNLPYTAALANSVGVYRLDVGESFLIGSGAGLGAIWSGHVAALRAGSHLNTKLQAAWVPGAKVSFTVLVEVYVKNWGGDDGVPRAKMLEGEVLAGLLGTPGCCNMPFVFVAPVRKAAPRLGYLHSPEIRARLSAAKTGAGNPRSKGCRFELNGETFSFETVTAAAKHFRVSQQLVDQWLRGVSAWPGTGARRTRVSWLVGLTGQYV